MYFDQRLGARFCKFFDAKIMENEAKISVFELIPKSYFTYFCLVKEYFYNFCLFTEGMNVTGGMFDRTGHFDGLLLNCESERKEGRA